MPGSDAALKCSGVMRGRGLCGGGVIIMSVVVVGGGLHCPRFAETMVPGATPQMEAFACMVCRFAWFLAAV